MKFQLLAVLMLFSTLCMAGGETGNGGDVVICKNPAGKIISSEMLDVYEGYQLHGISPQLGGDDLNLDEKIEFLLARINEHSPKIAKLLQIELKQFDLRAYFLWGVTLNDIPDSDHLYVLNNCAIKQIAIQGHIVSTPHGPRDIVIDHELFNTLDDDNVLALKLHEVLYTIALKKGHENSRQVRRLSSMLLSGLIDSKTVFKDIIKETKILEL